MTAADLEEILRLLKVATAVATELHYQFVSGRFGRGTYNPRLLLESLESSTTGIMRLLSSDRDRSQVTDGGAR